MDYDNMTAIEMAVFKLDLLDSMKFHGVVAIDADTEFFDTQDGARLLSFAQSIYKRGMAHNVELTGARAPAETK